VTVRPLREADAPALVRACQDPEIPRWTRVPQPYTLEDARRFVAVAAAEAAAGHGVALAVADAGDALLGTIGLMEVDRGAGRGEIGYWLARWARGRGAATRAVRLVTAWAAAELGLRRLEILTHPGNAPSARVAERAGFAATGETRRVARMPPGRRDGYRVHVWTAAP
jgi:RimJ/RimL family protein N-acetyltransferase